MSIRAAVPVLFGTLRLHLDKGRPWSLIEHLILQAVVEEPRSAASLSQMSDLPRRLIIEIVIRLMRVGWVELVSANKQTGFRATPMGREVAKLEQLPTVPKPFSRRAAYAVDMLTHTVFRARDFAVLYTQTRLEKVSENVEIVRLFGSHDEPEVPANVLDVLLDDDEYVRVVDPNVTRPSVRFGMVTVHGDTIDGLPKRTPRALKQKILEAASKRTGAARPVTTGTGVVQAKPSENVEIAFDQRDLILGGGAHRQALTDTLRKARSWIVVHSTFVRSERFKEFLPLFSDAARRGVSVHILWGKQADPDGSNSTADEVDKCRAMMTEDLLRERIQLQRFSTGSHAKILLADDGQNGMVAIVGSCNWLYSEFQSYEVSVRLRDPIIVSSVVGHLSVMANNPSGLWSPLTRELARLATNLKRAPQVGARRMRARLILGADHGECVRQARDEATARIVVASHRLGGSAEESVLVPAGAAIKAKEIDVLLYYGTPSGPVDGAAASTMVRDAGSKGIKIRRIHEPRMHAKFLVWDDDSVVITSQNWLSADPADSNQLSEIGVYLSGAKVGRQLVDNAKAALGGS